MTPNSSHLFPQVRYGAARFSYLAVAGLALTVWAAAAVGADAKETRDLPALFSVLEKTAVVTEGATTPKRVLYAFFDPNCTPCHFTWKALQAYERAGLQVRWVPVAYQKDSSAGRAHAVMQASDRAAALRELMQAREHEVVRRKNEARDRAGRSDGGGAPATGLPAAFVAQLDSNLHLMKRFGALGTPLLVWKDADGKVQLKIGMLRLSQLPAITGLPEQEIDDPALAEFR